MFCFFIKVSQAILPKHVLPHTEVDHPGISKASPTVGRSENKEAR